MPTTGADVRPETGMPEPCGTCSTACSANFTTASRTGDLRRVHRVPSSHRSWLINEAPAHDRLSS